MSLALNALTLFLEVLLLHMSVDVTGELSTKSFLIILLDTTAFDANLPLTTFVPTKQRTIFLVPSGMNHY